MDEGKIETKKGQFVEFANNKIHYVAADRTIKTIEFAEVQNPNDWSPLPTEDEIDETPRIRPEDAERF